MLAIPWRNPRVLHGQLQNKNGSLFDFPAPFSNVSLGLDSPYLKISRISCNGCENIQSVGCTSKNVTNPPNVTNPLNQSMHSSLFLYHLGSNSSEREEVGMTITAPILYTKMQNLKKASSKLTLF